MMKEYFSRNISQARRDIEYHLTKSNYKFRNTIEDSVRADRILKILSALTDLFLYLCIRISVTFFFQHFKITAPCRKRRVWFGNAFLV